MLKFNIGLSTIYDITKFNQDDEGADPSKVDTLMAVSDSTIMDSFTILSRMVRYSPSYFIWTRRRDHINFKHLQKDQLVNHFPNSDFTTKNGNLTDSQWAVMLEWYYQLAHQGALMPRAVTLYEQCHKMLHRMRRHWPQMDLDGMNNVWIVKPGAKSRGMGIMILERLEDILKLVEAQVFMKATKYVVQKYIERPLLIYNTKFDIRQWFLVTDWNPLTLYFYKECYLRFCSKPFSLKDKSEAIHLCNNSIQRNYIRRDGPRSILPDEYMWTSEEFREHLRLRGKGLTWENIVYPRMKKAVIATLVAAQDGAEVRKGCFELYGADFMLTEDFHPWLIEINSSPCMAPTTRVTGKMCAQVLEDSIKVLVDRRENRNCCLGNFELAYRHSTVSVPPYIGISLGVQGVGVTRPGRKLEDGTKEDSADDVYRRVEMHPKETRSSPGARPMNKENAVVRKRANKGMRASIREGSPKHGRNIITLAAKEKSLRKRAASSSPLIAPGGHGEPQLADEPNSSLSLSKKLNLASEIIQENANDNSSVHSILQKTTDCQKALLEMRQPQERQKAGCQFPLRPERENFTSNKWITTRFNHVQPTSSFTGSNHHCPGAKFMHDPYFAGRPNTVVSSDRMPICPETFYSRQPPQPESWSQLPPALKTYLRASSLLRTCHIPTSSNPAGGSVWQQLQKPHLPLSYRTTSERHTEIIEQQFEKDDTDMDDNISYKQWIHNGQTKLITLTTTVEEFISTICTDADNVTTHHFTAKS